MHKEDCIFCKISKREIPSQKIRENDEFYAFLDLSPNCKGQTLVIPKEHYDSDLFDISDEKFYGRYMMAIDTVVKLLKKSLWVIRVWIIMEGMGVNHLHIKLYPMWGLDHEWSPIEDEEKVFFKQYPGFLTTKMWKALTQEELAETAKEILWK